MGYEPKEKDAHDVLLLHQRLGVRLPRAYAPFLADAKKNARG
jgi:hypothetical protein